MFELFDVKILLPDTLAWLGDTPLKATLLTIVAWLLLGFLGYLLVFGMIRRLARRTNMEVDDVILRVSRNPLLTLALLLGVRDALDVLSGREGALGQVQSALEAAVIFVLGVWIWHVIRDVGIYYGEEFAEQSETNIDDILLPIVNQIAPLIVLGLAAALAARRLGFDPATLLVAIGGAAFIAAFALQDSLSNIFSGISLLVDTPFHYGDLVIVDDKVCVIEKIGLRVTQLYSADDHMVILMPNSQMANQRLVNITRPTPALMTPIKVTVGGGNDPRKVMAVLKEVADGHPNVLGDPAVKLPAIGREFRRLAEQGHWDEAMLAAKELKRWEAENRVNQELEALTTELDRLAIDVEEREEGGLSERERAEFRQRLREMGALIQTLKQTLTEWLLLMRFVIVDSTEKPETVEDIERVVNHYTLEVQRAITSGEVTLLGDFVIRRKENLALQRQLDRLLWRRGFFDLDCGLSDLDQVAEFSELIRSWNKKVQRLEQGLEALEKMLGSGEERRLDDAVRRLRDWAYTGLKETTPEWKYPEVVFDSIVGGFHFTLQVFVDDIRREHYERQERVYTQLRQRIIEAFREAEITFPTPRTDVALLPTSRVVLDSAGNGH